MVSLDQSNTTYTGNVAEVGDSSESKRGKVPIAAIVGGILGALALLLLLLFFCLWRKRRSQVNGNGEMPPTQEQDGVSLKF
jgi:hypothetical protein